MKHFSYYFILSFLFLTVSCGKKAMGLLGNKPVRSLHIENEFKPYVAQFESRSQEQGRSIKISNLVVVMSDELPSNVLGTCTTYTKDVFPPKIRINRSFWGRLDTVAKEELIFHELGHCVLRRGHRDAYSSSEGHKIPVSVMNTYHFSSRYYTANYKQYMHELFKKADLVSAFPLAPNAYASSWASSFDESMFESGEETFENYESNESNEPEIVEDETTVNEVIECGGSH